MNKGQLEKLNNLNSKIEKLEKQINSCNQLKYYHNLNWIMKSYNHEYVNMTLDHEESRLMDDFIDKLIYKKEKELHVLKEEFSKY